MERKSPSAFYPYYSGTEIVGRWQEEQFLALPEEEREKILACGRGEFCDRKAPMPDREHLLSVQMGALRVMERTIQTALADVHHTTLIELQSIGIPDHEICTQLAYRIAPQVQAEVAKELHKASFHTRIALEEGLQNAYRHGNKCDPRKDVICRSRSHAGAVQYVISDQGAGFDPDAVPDPTVEENQEKPSGRGLLLMRTFMDSVNYSDGGRTLTMGIDIGDRIAKKIHPILNTIGDRVHGLSF